MNERSKKDGALADEAARGLKRKTVRSGKQKDVGDRTENPLPEKDYSQKQPD
jgi:hypothetical protein